MSLLKHLISDADADKRLGTCIVCGPQVKITQCRNGRKQQYWACHSVVSAKYRRRDLKRAFGLSTEGYGLLLKQQDYRCAICGDTDPGKSGDINLCVDHDHVTGKIRGLLCHPCNLMLGKAHDDAERLRKAANYLDYHAELHE